MNVIRSVLRFVRRSRWLAALFVICLVVDSAYSSLSPLSFKYLIDGAFVPKDMDMFWLVMALLVVGGAVAMAASILGERLLAHITERAMYDLRHRIFDQMSKQSIDFYNRFDQGTLMSRLTSDISALEYVVSGVVPNAIQHLLVISIGVVLLVQLEWSLTLILAGGLILLFLCPNLLRSKATRSSSNYREVHDRYVGTVDEMTKGYRVVRGLNLKRFMMNRAEQKLRDLYTAGFQVTFIYALLNRLPLLVFMILNGGAIGYGGYLIFQDKLSIGSFVSFYTIFLFVGQSVSSFSQLIPELFRAEVSLMRINELLDYRSTLSHADRPEPLHGFRESIRFHQVSFGYSDDRLALERVTFEIPHGSLTAFVGPSGSGKSTAMQLLMRFYDPQQGRISIDGKDLRHLDEEQFRERMGAVFQDSFLFNMPIEDNIRVACPQATDEDVREAAKAAQIHDYIMQLPDQYKTEVKEFGASMSGGQRQRLAIARALIKRPQLLLLDEVTSALDPNTEAEINGLIESLRGERTIVTVTHRLQSVVNADRIVVFQHGRVAEIGTHEELLIQNGVYKEMWDKQNGFVLTGNGFSAKVTGERLSQLPFFRGIPPEQLHLIAELFITETYDPDYRLIRENEPGDKFYIIVRGSVSIIRQGVPVARLEDGDHFGEIALLRDIPRTADVVVRLPTILLSLRRDQLLMVMERFPSIRSILEQSLQERMKDHSLLEGTGKEKGRNEHTMA